MFIQRNKYMNKKVIAAFKFSARMFQQRYIRQIRKKIVCAYDFPKNSESNLSLLQ